MTQEAKLQKIIEKALENGWKDIVSRLVVEDILQEVHECGCSEILFSHSFAKAIWGEERVTGLTGDEYYEYPNWQHHIQQAVISDDPIDYYYKNM